MLTVTSSVSNVALRAHTIKSRANRITTRSISEDLKQSISQQLLREKPRIYVSTISGLHDRLLFPTLRSFLPTQSLLHHDNSIPPGHHLLHFPTLVHTNKLLRDGTDNHFSPRDPWKQRLWAGGRIQFPQKPFKYWGKKKVLIEFVRDVRFQGQDKIFVKIERRIGEHEPHEDAETTLKRIKRKEEDDLTSTLVMETRDLCFLPAPDLENPPVRERRTIAPPTDPEYTYSLTPTSALLFRFSAMTFNAHAIHIDPEYTRKVYGLPNLLVHGPLSLLLMLKYLHHIVTDLEPKKNGLKMAITEINYRNLAPLFVDEKMTICCKRKSKKTGHVSTSQTTSSAPDGQDQAQGSAEWDVWIQTGHGEQKSLAVRGTVKVEALNMKPLKELKIRTVSR